MTVVLKECVINGDMSSDSTAENYPEVPVCEDCIEEDAARREDSQIVSVGGDVDDPDAACEFCGAVAED